MSTTSNIGRKLNSYFPYLGMILDGVRSGLIFFLGLFGASILAGLVLGIGIFLTLDAAGLESLGLSSTFDWLYSVFFFTYLFSASSLGITTNLAEADALNGLVVVDIFGAPTLVTIIALVYLYKSARGFSILNGGSTWEKISRSFGKSVSVSIALVLVTAALGSATPGFVNFGNVAGLDFLDFFTAGGLVFVSSLAGHFSYSTQPEKRFVSIRWALWSLWYVVVIAIVVLFFAFIVLWIYNTVNPDFGIATRQLPAPGLEVPGIVAVIVLLVALLFMPTILFYILSYIFGSSVGYTGDLGAFSDILFGLGVTDFLDGTSLSLGEVSALGLLLAFFIALFAGAAAGTRVNISSKHPTAVIAIFLAALSATAVSVRLTNFGISTTNGVEFASPDSPEPFQFETILGVLLPSILFVAIVITIGAYLGGLVFQDTLVSSSRGFTSILIQRNLMNREVGFDGIVVGTLVGLLVFISAAVPWTIATVNKATTALTGPEVFAENWLGFYEADVPTALQAVSPRNDMIPNKILEKALPEKYSSEISSTDSIGEDWVPGNLRANTITTVTLEDDSFEIEMNSSATIKSDFPLTYSDFSHQIFSGAISFEKVGAAEGSDGYPLIVNGESLEFGAYHLIPGVYEVEVPDNGMVAGFQETLYISSNELIEIQVGDEVLLDEDQRDQISTILTAPETECLGESTDDSETCVDIEDLMEKAELGPDVPRAFAVLEGYSNGQLNSLDIDKKKTAEEFTVSCTEPDIELTSTSDSLPVGVEPDIETAFGYSECTFSLEYADVYTDNVFDEEYRLDYISESTLQMLIIATARDGVIEIGELDILNR